MDTEQGLCLGALFDIAATNVNKPFHYYFYCLSCYLIVYMFFFFGASLLCFVLCM